MAAHCVPRAAGGACGVAIHPPGSAARGLPAPAKAMGQCLNGPVLSRSLP
jgi:hypothetical protein